MIYMCHSLVTVYYTSPSVEAVSLLQPIGRSWLFCSCCRHLYFKLWRALVQTTEYWPRRHSGHHTCMLDNTSILQKHGSNFMLNTALQEFCNTSPRMLHFTCYHCSFHTCIIVLISNFSHWVRMDPGVRTSPHTDWLFDWIDLKIHFYPGSRLPSHHQTWSVPQFPLLGEWFSLGWKKTSRTWGKQYSKKEKQ